MTTTHKITVGDTRTPLGMVLRQNGRGVDLTGKTVKFALYTALGAVKVAETASNITQQVDKLVTSGLLERAERRGDRRYVSLTLTADGEQVAGEYSAAARAYLRDALAILTPAELDQLTQLLMRIAEHAPSPAAAPVRA